MGGGKAAVGVGDELATTGKTGGVFVLEEFPVGLDGEWLAGGGAMAA
jgi:hypothetical protein